MNIQFLKAIDRFGGRLLVWMLPHPVKTIPSSQPQSFLLIRPGGIGDAVLLIPTLISLKRRFPHAVIHVLAEKRNSAAFSLCNCIDGIYQYDTQKGLLNAVRGSYDVVIDTEQWHRLSAAVARLNNAPVLVGFATNERDKLFTRTIPYSKDEYEVGSFLNLITQLTGVEELHPVSPFLLIPSTSQEYAKAALLSVQDHTIVVMFPGGSIAEKRWGAENYREVAAQLASQGCAIVVVGGKRDIHAGEVITRGLSRSLNLCGKLSLPETAAVLQQSSLLVTGDSGIMHIGYGVGVKIVALFGPGNERKWAPRGSDCIVINKKLACSPCSMFGYTPRCSKNAACMSEITVAEVYNAGRKLLEQP